MKLLWKSRPAAERGRERERAIGLRDCTAAAVAEAAASFEWLSSRREMLFGFRWGDGVRGKVERRRVSFRKAGRSLFRCKAFLCFAFNLIFFAKCEM